MPGLRAVLLALCCALVYCEDTASNEDANLELDRRATWLVSRRNVPESNMKHPPAIYHSSAESEIAFDDHHLNSLEAKEHDQAESTKDRHSLLLSGENKDGDKFDRESRARWRPIKRFFENKYQQFESGDETQGFADKRAAWLPMKRIINFEDYKHFNPAHKVENRASWRPIKKSFYPTNHFDSSMERRASWRPIKRKPEEAFDNEGVGEYLNEKRAFWRPVRSVSEHGPGFSEDKRPDWIPIKRSTRRKRSAYDDDSSELYMDAGSYPYADENDLQDKNLETNWATYLRQLLSDNDNGRALQKDKYESPLGHFINGRSQNYFLPLKYDIEDYQRPHESFGEDGLEGTMKRATWLAMNKRMPTRMATRDPYYLDEEENDPEFQMEAKQLAKDLRDYMRVNALAQRMATRHVTRMPTRDLESSNEKPEHLKHVQKQVVDRLISDLNSKEDRKADLMHERMPTRTVGAEMREDLLGPSALNIDERAMWLVPTSEETKDKHHS